MSTLRDEDEGGSAESAPPDSASEQSVQRSPHDDFIKGILQSKEEAISVLRSALPREVTNRIDWPTLRAEPTEQIDAELAKRYNDLLFRVNLVRDEPGAPEREVFIEIALEHQSRSERMMALRMLGLIVRRTELLLRAASKRKHLPIVLPVVLFQGRGRRMRPWSHPVRYSQLLDADQPTLDAFRRFIPDFEFALDDLTQQPKESLYQRELTAIARIALTLLREAKSNPLLLQQLRNPRDLAEWRLASDGPNGAVVLQLFWGYLYRVVDFPTEDLQDFARTVSELAERTQMTTAQRIIDKAAPQLRDEGRKEGLKEGETRGRAALLQRQLQFKFGDLDPAFVSRIASASADQLDSWAERIIVAASIDELFRQ